MSEKFIEARSLIELVQMFPTFMCDPTAFRRDSTIGKGGFGDVWLGVEPVSGSRSAVKEMRVEELKGRTLRRFIREIETMAIAMHRFVIPIIGFSVNIPYYIFTEYCPRGSLDKYIFTNKLSPTMLQLIAICIALGMAHVHSKKIVHRDLKSANILLDDQMLPRICDFGLAIFEDPHRKQYCQSGTTMYMAPEMFIHEPFNHKCDIFSFAMLLYEMSESHVPWPGLDKDDIQTNISAGKRPEFRSTPSDLKKLIVKCWSTDPNKRPEFHEIAEDLSTFRVCFSNCEKSTVTALLNQVLEAERMHPSALKQIAPNARVNAESIIKQLKEGPPVPLLALHSEDDDKDPSKSLILSIEAQNDSRIPIGPYRILVDNRKTGDIPTLATPTSKYWLENTVLVAQQIRETQYLQFFTVMKQNIPNVTSDKVLVILDSFILVHKHHPTFGQFLVQQKYFDSPIVEPKDALKLTISLFANVFLSHTIPAASLKKGFHLLVQKSPYEMLMIYQTFIQKCKPSLQEIAEIGDALIVSNGSFLKSPNAQLFTQVFYFLLKNYPPYRKVRGSAVIPLLTNLLRSSEIEVVQIALNALIALKEESQIDSLLILRIITNPQLHNSAMSCMIRLETLPKNPEAIELLSRAADMSKYPKFLLMRYAQEQPELLMLNSNWLIQGCPTFADSIQVFLILVVNPQNYPKVSLMMNLPSFLKQVVMTNDHFNIQIISKVVLKISIDQSLLQTLSMIGFVRQYLQVALYDIDINLVIGGLQFLDKIARIGYLQEYLEVLQLVVAALSKDGALIWAIIALMSLSVYPVCAAQMKELGIFDYCKSLTQYPDYQQYASIIVQNLSK